jgi:hypothetical protein
MQKKTKRPQLQSRPPADYSLYCADFGDAFWTSPRLTGGWDLRSGIRHLASGRPDLRSGYVTGVPGLVTRISERRDLPSGLGQSASSGPEMRLQDPETALQDPETPLRDPETPLRNPETPLRNPETLLQDPEMPLQDPEIALQDPEMPLQDPEIALQDCQIRPKDRKRQ